jgi:hypothetical protein
MKNGAAEKQYNPQILVILDYSGTLSVEAPDFGKPDNLVQALAESGLAACGLADPAIFWERIVFPTWDEAGRTGIGFAKSMADRIAALDLPVVSAAGNSPPSPERAPLFSSGELPYASIAEAAERFVSMYLAHSRPEPLWRPILENLHADSRLAVVVATDHYAEATAAIIHHLRDWGITARRIDQGASSPPTDPERRPGQDNQPPPLLVANSADLGFWKTERPFWKIVRKPLPYHFQHIIIIDDFGFNEADEVGYGMLVRVRERRIKTRTVVKDVFRTDVSVLPFLTKTGNADKQDAHPERILKTLKKIEGFLALHGKHVESSPENTCITR